MSAHTRVRMCGLVCESLAAWYVTASVTTGANNTITSVLGLLPSHLGSRKLALNTDRNVGWSDERNWGSQKFGVGFLSS